MKRIAYISLLIFLGIACKKPYNPPAIAATGSYLVVEGVINAGSDSTFIKLSKTVSLSSSTKANPVLQAIVTVISDQRNSFPLTERGHGNYVSPGLNLDNTRKYYLSIKTLDNEQYQSDLEAVNITPPIDSVGYTMPGDGIKIYLSTHDSTGITKYFRWDYRETWQFHAAYNSVYTTNGTEIIHRPRSQSIFNCFTSDTVSNIILASTADLKQGVINQIPITQIASTSEKLETKYSILVNQYALTGNAYNFWVNLKTNTEQLGSIFDAQPSTFSGNIHCTTNPTEPVLGYVSVSTVQHKRIFIANSQLPQTWFPAYLYNCQLDSLLFCQGLGCLDEVALYLIPKGSATIPVDAIYKGGALIGYYSSTIQCLDCTLRGTLIQPAFWK